eukprot:6488233-Amphidinium_carterae.1
MSTHLHGYHSNQPTLVARNSMDRQPRKWSRSNRTPSLSLTRSVLCSCGTVPLRLRLSPLHTWSIGARTPFKNGIKTAKGLTQHCMTLVVIAPPGGQSTAKPKSMIFRIFLGSACNPMSEPSIDA